MKRIGFRRPGHDGSGETGPLGRAAAPHRRSSQLVLLNQLLNYRNGQSVSQSLPNSYQWSQRTPNRKHRDRGLPGCDTYKVRPCVFARPVAGCARRAARAHRQATRTRKWLRCRSRPIARRSTAWRQPARCSAARARRREPADFQSFPSTIGCRPHRTAQGLRRRSVKSTS